MDKNCYCTGSWIRIINPTFFQFFLCVLEHLFQVTFNLLLRLKFIKISLLSVFFYLRRNIVICSLTSFSSWRSMSIINRKEAASLTYVLQYTACILALLFFRSWAHQRWDIHFNILNNESCFLFVALFILFLLLLTLALAKET